MKTKKQILLEMEEEMPFELNPKIKPYIFTAMNLFAYQKLKINKQTTLSVSDIGYILKSFQDFVNTCQTFEMIEDNWIEDFIENL